jgi:hypothetical protein
MKDEEVEVDSETVEAKEFTVFRKGMLTCKNNSFKDWIRKTRPKRNPVLSAVVDIFKMNRGIVNMRVQNQKAMDIVLNCTQSVLDAEVAVAKAKGETVGSVVLLALGCPCGRTYNYKTVQDVPKKTTMCPCGAAVIEYALDYPVGIEPPAGMVVGERPLITPMQAERIIKRVESQRVQSASIKWKGRFEEDPKADLKATIRRMLKNKCSQNKILGHILAAAPSGYTQKALEQKIRSSIRAESSSLKRRKRCGGCNHIHRRTRKDKGGRVSWNCVKAGCPCPVLIVAGKRVD